MKDNVFEYEKYLLELLPLCPQVKIEIWHLKKKIEQINDFNTIKKRDSWNVDQSENAYLAHTWIRSAHKSMDKLRAVNSAVVSMSGCCGLQNSGQCLSWLLWQVELVSFRSVPWKLKGPRWTLIYIGRRYASSLEMAHTASYNCQNYRIFCRPKVSLRLPLLLLLGAHYLRLNSFDTTLGIPRPGFHGLNLSADDSCQLLPLLLQLLAKSHRQ